MMERGPPHAPRTIVDLSLDTDFSAALNRKSSTFFPHLVPRLSQTYSRPSVQANRIPPHGTHVLGKARRFLDGREQFLGEAKRLLKEAYLQNGDENGRKRLDRLLRREGVAVKFEWKGSAQSSVFLAGSFNHWGMPAPMNRVNGQWECVLRLTAKTYNYKFVVDGEWAVDKSRLCAGVPGRGVVNRLIVEIPQPIRFDDNMLTRI